MSPHRHFLDVVAKRYSLRNLLPGNFSFSISSSCERTNTNLSGSRALAEALICRQLVSSAEGTMLKPLDMDAVFFETCSEHREGMTLWEEVKVGYMKVVFIVLKVGNVS